MAKLVRNKDKIQIDSNLMKYLRYGEEVKAIPNHNNYFITNTGRVFSGKYKIEYKTIEGQDYYCVVWKELKPRLANGYLSVNITDSQGIRKREYIHHLVFITFSGEFLDKAVLKIVHKDKDKLNNNINNLGLALRKKDDYQAHRSYVYRAKMQETLI